ncbi:10549_t:CDS:2 [Paraglomus occultum]|uniref:10549_t:CDS:1 n=1 Tax=Paraglomus occultum TaxID=144539 RepID=A0A9N9AZP0_9GLOM|nr:10549_t:CDS:2 [Paraglomus occultum]
MGILKVLDKINLWLSILATCALAYFRDAHVSFAILGAVTTSIIVRILKRIIRQPRPKTALKPRTTYGMPSTHSASTMYFAVYTSLYLASSVPTLTVFRTLFITILLGVALFIVWSRVELGHHTGAQVIAGTIAGCVCAAACHSLWWEYGLPLSVDLGLNRKLEVNDIGIVIDYVWDVFTRRARVM